MYIYASRQLFPLYFTCVDFPGMFKALPTYFPEFACALRGLLGTTMMPESKEVASLKDLPF